VLPAAPQKTGLQPPAVRASAHAWTATAAQWWPAAARLLRSAQQQAAAALLPLHCCSCSGWAAAADEQQQWPVVTSYSPGLLLAVWAAKTTATPVTFISSRGTIAPGKWHHDPRAAEACDRRALFASARRYLTPTLSISYACPLWLGIRCRLMAARTADHRGSVGGAFGGQVLHMTGCVDIQHPSSLYLTPVLPARIYCSSVLIARSLPPFGSILSAVLLSCFPQLLSPPEQRGSKGMLHVSHAIFPQPSLIVLLGCNTREHRAVRCCCHVMLQTVAWSGSLFRGLPLVLLFGSSGCPCCCCCCACRYAAGDAGVVIMSATIQSATLLRVPRNRVAAVFA
jgi:hypothetical protein